MNALHPLREPAAPTRVEAEIAPVPALDTLLDGAGARVTMADGKRVSGRVVKFDGPGRTLEFAWDGIVPALPIAFSSLRAVEVLDSVEPFHRAGARRCFVEFADGTALALNAAMIAECGYGLFVFGPGRGSSLRCRWRSVMEGKWYGQDLPRHHVGCPRRPARLRRLPLVPACSQ